MFKPQVPCEELDKVFFEDLIEDGYIPTTGIRVPLEEDPRESLKRLKAHLDGRAHTFLVVPATEEGKAVGQWAYAPRNLKRVRPSLWKTFRRLYRQGVKAGLLPVEAFNWAFGILRGKLLPWTVPKDKAYRVKWDD